VARFQGTNVQVIRRSRHRQAYPPAIGGTTTSARAAHKIIRRGKYDHRLNAFPKLFVDDGRMLAGIGVTLVCDLAAVSPVLEQQIERAVQEPLVSIFGSIRANPSLALDACGSQFFRERAD
jgi:hypothetical protein